MRTLVLFDVDGTLVRSLEFDAALYAESLAAVFGFADWSPEREPCEHVSDSGIAVELCVRRRGHAPSAAELDALRRDFSARVRRWLARHRLEAIPGAAESLRMLAASRDHALAIATGGFESTARAKLAAAGIDAAGVPLASADDALARTDIAKAAWARAEAQHGVELERAVFVGDGIWDAEACARLDLPMVGIGAGQGARGLAERGVEPVLPDLDPAGLLGALARARRPG